MTLLAPPFILFDTANQKGTGKQSFLLSDPEKTISAFSKCEAGEALKVIDISVQMGKTVGAFFAYELGVIFEPKLAEITSTPPEILPAPLIYVFINKTDPVTLTNSEVISCLSGTESSSFDLEILESPDLEDWFKDQFHKVKDYINAGDVYQINLTFPYNISFRGDLKRLYLALRQHQPASFSAYIDTGDHIILSLSPEQFVTLQGDRLEARPMKGTIRRGLSAAADNKNKRSLQADEKSRAENLMITDLLRNDLSKIAQVSSVKTEKLFMVETLPTLHQMISVISAKAISNLSPGALLSALFPCGSVTGAPKVRAQEIIASLEKGARGVYCGAVCLFTHQNDQRHWSLSVPIRTLTFDKNSHKNTTEKMIDMLEPLAQKGIYHVGAGLVADSQEEEELAECRLKANFIRDIVEPSPMKALGSPTKPYLIETMACRSGKIDYITHHLDRIDTSARFFDYPFCRLKALDLIDRDLRSRQTRKNDSTLIKIRLMLSATGHTALSSEIIDQAPPEDNICKISLHQHRINPDDIWLRHKTTHRWLYTTAFQHAQAAGLTDYIFMNKNGAITEGCIHSIFIKQNNGIFLTPPVKDGCLPGILRRTLLASGQAEEKSITLEDLKSASKVWIGNALKGLREAHYIS